MKVSALVPWFGAKRQMADKIIAELGKHGAYFEPYCGSAAILFAKAKASQETVNDIHGDLINLARVVQDDAGAEQLFDRLSRTMFAEPLFDSAALEIVASDPPAAPYPIGQKHIERAYVYFIVSWMGRNGAAGTKQAADGGGNCMSVRWTPGGGGSGIRFKNVVDSIPDWFDRLRNVQILRRDAIEVIKEIEDDERTTIYVDPPYFKETRGNGGGSTYLHDFDDKDHVELATELNRFKSARVVVSYYEEPRVSEFYEGWTYLRFDIQKNMVKSSKREKNDEKAPEVLVINQKSLVSDEGLFG